MTIGKFSALTAGFVGAFALGVVIGPSITRNDVMNPEPMVSVAPAPADAAKTSARAARTPRTTAKVERADPETIASDTVASRPASEPQLHERLKTVLNKGARIEVAAEGFKDGEQFATVAHASRNTQVPFMVLKHHVLNEGQSLADAIHTYKPELDAQHEAKRARNAARFDLEVIAN